MPLDVWRRFRKRQPDEVCRGLVTLGVPKVVRGCRVGGLVSASMVWKRVDGWRA